MSDTKLHSWPEIQDYKLEDLLGRGGMGAVYRAVPLQDRTRRVAIKVIDKTGQIPHDAIVNFQKEAALMGQLYHPNIVYFVDFGRIAVPRQTEASYFIVMELVKGQSLREYLQSPEFQSLNDVNFLLAIGKQLTAALDYTHSRGIIHRDIKPQNIMLDMPGNNLNEMSVKLLDFGVAGLSDAYQSLGLGKTTGIEDFAGTPLYQAPEQSGLSNWTSDHRVDLYSLGCLFFEILAKKTPFTADTRQELREKHLNQAAPRLKDLRPDLPTVLCDMIDKCLKKNPDDRYGSAFSLLADLIEVEKSMQTGAEIVGLGRLDRCKAIISTARLVGRDTEYESLLNFYNALENETRSRISVITGARGSGKSRLVKELRKNLISRKVRFVSGTFTRYDANLSFNCLALAFDDYLIKIRRDLPEEAELLSENLNEVLGQSLLPLSKVIPGLQSYTNMRTELDSTDSSTNTKAFLAKNFLDFTTCLMRDDQPLVFIFEDLHLADNESLDLIDAFFTNANSERIYLVISYLSSDRRSPVSLERQNENKLYEFLEKIKKLKRRSQHIFLKPLSENESDQLIEEILQDKSVSKNYKKWANSHCDGIPIHILETTKSLILQKKLIRNDREWSIDLNGISQIEYRSNNSDIDLAKILKYPDSHRWAINIASAIGSKFTGEQLIVDNLTDAQIVSETIMMAKKDGIFKSVRNPDGSQSNELEFLHLGVQEMVLTGIPQQTKKFLFIEVGKALLKKKNDDNLLYRSARLFNRAESEMGGLSAPDKILALDANISAAKRATLLNDDEFAIDFLDFSLNYYMDANKDPEQFVSVFLEKIRLIMRKNLQQKNVLGLLKQIAHLKLSKKLQLEVTEIIFQCYYEQGNFNVSNQIALSLISSNKNKKIDDSFKHYLFAIINLIADAFYIYKFLPNFTSIARLKYGISADRPRTRFLAAYNKANLMIHRSKLQEIKSQLGAGRIAWQGDCAEPENVLYILSRISFLLRYGFRRSANRIMRDMGPSIHQLSSSSMYRIALTKNIVIDTLKKDKLSEFIRNAKKYPLIVGVDQNILEVNHRLLVTWHYLMKGQLIRAKDESLVTLNRLPSTHPLSSFCLYLFCLSSVLTGERSEVVDQFTNWKKSRKKEFKTHKKDLFEKLVETFVYTIKSESELSTQQYIKIKQSIIHFPVDHSLQRIKELAFEFYIVFFPLFAQSEFGARLRDLTENETAFNITSFMNRLADYLKIIYPKKIQRFLRKADRLFQSKASEQKARETIKVFRHNSSTQNLLELVKKLDAANKIWNSIHRIPEDAAILENLIKAVNALNYRGLSSVLERMLASLNYTSVQDINSGTIKAFTVDRLNFISSLTSEVTKKFCIDPISVSLDQAFEEFSNLCRRHGATGGMYFIPSKDFTFPARKLAGNTSLADLQPTLDGYTDLAYVTLVSLRPANQKSAEQPPLKNQKIDFSQTQYLETKYSPTNLASEPEMDEIYQERKQSFDNNMQTEASTKVTPHFEDRRQSLGAVLPLYFHQFKLGHLFIEEMRKEYQSQHHIAIKELGFASRIFSSFLFLKIGPDDLYQQKNEWLKPMAHLEPCAWLHGWLHGFHNNDSDSAWFYGAQIGKDKYIIGHVALQRAAPRENNVSRLLWLFFQEWLHEHKINHSQTALKILEQEVGWILQNWAVGVEDLKLLNVSFTLIHRGDYRVETFSFGNTLAMILGGDNKQRVHNDAVISINQGTRLIYRYSGSGSIESSLPLICTADPKSMQSRLDSTARSFMRRAFQEFADNPATFENLHGVLRSIIGIDHTPRYYAGFIKKNSVE